MYSETFFKDGRIAIKIPRYRVELQIEAKLRAVDENANVDLWSASSPSGYHAPAKLEEQRRSEIVRDSWRLERSRLHFLRYRREFNLW